MQPTDPYQRRTPCPSSSSSSSYHQVFARNITFCTLLHAYTATRYMHKRITVRPPDFIPNSHVLATTCIPDVATTTTCASGHDITSTSVSMYVRLHFLVPRFVAVTHAAQRRARHSKARDAMRRSTTVRRSCSVLQGCEDAFRILHSTLAPCPRAALAPLSAAEARGVDQNQAFLRRCR
jgi:hypothetical protein